jgi:hypothetical protein
VRNKCFYAADLLNRTQSVIRPEFIMTNMNIAMERREKTAQLKWGVFLLMFFLIQAVIWTVAISVTATDQSHAVVAGYDERALLWDEEKARMVASELLGWKAGITVAESADLRQFRELQLKLVDREGVPIENAIVKLTVFHKAWAAQPQDLVLSEVAGGIYQGNLQVRKSGKWQFNGTITQLESLFLVEQTQTITVDK